MISDRAATCDSVRGISSYALKEIRLFVACHAWVVALETECVERIVPESTGLHSAGELHGTEGLVGILRDRDSALPAWDLGRILGLENLDGAWVFMRQGDQRLALRTGGYLSVGALPNTAVDALPRGIFSRPERPFLTGAFSTASHLPYSKNSMFAGLEFDLTELWSQSAKVAVDDSFAKNLTGEP